MVGAFLMPKSRKGGALWREVESRVSRSRSVAILPSLKGVNSEIKNTQSQLKNVEKLLKYDALQREIIETEEYLKKL